MVIIYDDWLGFPLKNGEVHSLSCKKLFLPNFKQNGAWKYCECYRVLALSIVYKLVWKIDNRMNESVLSFDDKCFDDLEGGIQQLSVTFSNF